MMKMPSITTFSNLFESLIGRSGLWRGSRRLYLAARRDGMGDPITNGEYGLHRIVAKHAAGRRAGMTVIDVGAFSGYWSHNLLTQCQLEGVGDVRLLAFEPSEESRKKFARRMEGAFPRYQVRVRPEAISHESGEALFNFDPSFAGAQSLLPSENGQVPRAATTQVVKVMTLVDVFAEEGLSAADFVKTDAEGFDLNIIRGAMPLLAVGKIGLLQFEYNPCWLNTRTQLRDVFDLLNQIPYRLCKVAPSGLEAYQAWHYEIERFYEANYALVRNDLLEAYGVENFAFDTFNTLRKVG
jgi:FkbM family methyltransferase